MLVFDAFLYYQINLQENKKRFNIARQDGSIPTSLTTTCRVTH